MSNNKDIGNYGENLACEYLKENNYIILKRNYRSKIGEIDILASKSKILYVFEVKTRYSFKFGAPRECINKIKKRNIIATAQKYICENKLYKNNVEFDLIEVRLNYQNDQFAINHIKNIF